MARKQLSRKATLTLSARVTKQTDALRTELQQRLDIPLHDLIDRGFRALKSDLDEQHSAPAGMHQSMQV